MPEELDHVATLCPVGEAGTASDQLYLLQLGKVLLGLTTSNADLFGESIDGGKALPVPAGVTRQSPLGQLGARRDQNGPHQGFRDEDTGEQTKRIEGLAELKCTRRLAFL